MSALLQSIEPLARTTASVAINALWQDAAILLCVGLLLRIWRNANATTRYATWLVALVAAIALPVATTLSAGAGSAATAGSAAAVLPAARFAHPAPSLARSLRRSALLAPRHIHTPRELSALRLPHSSVRAV